MNWKVISRNVGFALLVSALFMFLSVLVSIFNGNDSALAALMISFLITAIVGAFPFIFVRSTNKISLKEGYVIITLSWLLSFVFGMLPYALWGGPFSLQNAWFESVSGFTTTGATILDNVEALPNSLLFWRASTHFIGGLGVVVFLLLIIPDSSPMRMRLTNMELSSLSKSEYAASSNHTVYIFAYVYFGLLALSFVAYVLAGMTPLDAICHAMSVCATGGFSTRNTSIAAFDSHVIEAITMVFMYLSSLHFGLIYISLATRSLKPLTSNHVVRWYTYYVLIVAIIISVGFKVHDICDSWGSSLWNGLFETLCVTSTTGFALLDNAHWPLWMITILMFCGFVCAMAGSTSGGVKVDRIMLFFKGVSRRVNVILHPSEVNEVKMGRKYLSDSEVYPHVLYIVLYGFICAVSATLCYIIGVDDLNSVIASIACLGNIGPAYGDMGTMGSFNAIPAAAKLLFSMEMFFGRIEIYPVLAIVGMIFDKRNR